MSAVRTRDVTTFPREVCPWSSPCGLPSNHRALKVRSCDFGCRKARSSFKAVQRPTSLGGCRKLLKLAREDERTITAHPIPKLRSAKCFLKFVPGPQRPVIEIAAGLCLLQ